MKLFTLKKKDKKTEVSKTDCLASAMTQWCVMNLIMGNSNDGNGWHYGLYFTQMKIVSSDPVKSAETGQAIRTLTFDGFFTTMKLAQPRPSDSKYPTRASVHAEYDLALDKDGKWMPVKASVKISDCAETCYAGAQDSFKYDINYKNFRGATQMESNFAHYWERVWDDGPVAKAAA